MMNFFKPAYKMTEKEIKEREKIAGIILCFALVFVIIFLAYTVIFGIAELDLGMIVAFVAIFLMLVYFANDIRKKFKS